MQKYFCRTKIIICGKYPQPGFEIDRYIEKTMNYQAPIDMKSDDFIFEISGSLLRANYNGKDNSLNYEYLINKQLIEYTYESIGSKEEVVEYLTNLITAEVEFLQKKIRLITGIAISFPTYFTNIYDSENNFYSKFGDTTGVMPILTLQNYNEKMIEKLDYRANFHIKNFTIEDLQNKDDRFKRALNFYDNSFNVYDKAIRFTLLISALESLFNINGENISKEIAKYSSKIMFFTHKKTHSRNYKIKTYYDIRSRYIHGNKDCEISQTDLENLIDYVREILIVYWSISLNYSVTNAEEIKNIIETHSKEDLNIQVKVIIEYLTSDPTAFREMVQNIFQYQ